MITLHNTNHDRDGDRAIINLIISTGSDRRGRVCSSSKGAAFFGTLGLIEDGDVFCLIEGLLIGQLDGLRILVVDRVLEEFFVFDMDVLVLDIFESVVFCLLQRLHGASGMILVVSHLFVVEDVGSLLGEELEDLPNRKIFCDSIDFVLFSTRNLFVFIICSIIRS